MANSPKVIALLLLLTVVRSFLGTLMFTASGNFFSLISDPYIGGSYLTLLNTIHNMGVLLPNTPIFFLIDKLSAVQCQEMICRPPEAPKPLPLACPAPGTDQLEANECLIGGGVCVTVRDGFLWTSYTLLALGAALILLFKPLVKHVQELPLDAWRLKAPQEVGGSVDNVAEEVNAAK